MLTFQDFERADDKKGFILYAINMHENSEDYQIATDADEYDKQKNVTIVNYIKTMYTISTVREPKPDITPEMASF